MRCTSCAFEWFAVPDDAPDSPDAGLDDHVTTEATELAAAEGDGGIPDVDDFLSHLAEAERLEKNIAAISGAQGSGDIESAAGKIRLKTRRPARRSDWRGWAALAAGLTLVIGAAYEYREPIVRSLPATSAVYSVAGLEVNVRGMEFTNVNVDREFENGLPVLAVTGEVINVSERVIDVPRIRLGLRDAYEQEIYHWTIAVSSDPILPNARAPFATKLAAPPAQARDVMIRFHDVGMRIGGL